MVIRGLANAVGSASFSPDGRRLVTGEDDRTARIWNVRAEPLEVQIPWAEAAQFDALSAAERFQLGLSRPPGVRIWTAGPSKCDELAAAPYDPERRAPGVALQDIAPDPAIEACTQAVPSSDRSRTVYQRARALVARQRFADARVGFEQVQAHYPAARIDLARLLLRSDASMLDPAAAIALFESAWKDGVAAAAFQLAQLYEQGVAAESGNGVAADADRAWRWYRSGAAAGEPNSLARYGDKAYAAASEPADTARNHELMLAAFGYYAAATEHARREDWPDAAFRSWRYRRASLARLLARDGMMPEVAAAYLRARNVNSPNH
jgi:TPR repeat protein